MALVLPNSIFFHLPKTGGTFVRKTIKDLGIANKEVGDHHESVADFSRKYPDIINGKFVFTFVRHPLTWWQSYWACRYRSGWYYDNPMDRACNDNDFNQYIDKILNCDWRTNYSDICNGFLIGRVDLIGKQEDLVADLKSALLRAGEKFDQNSLGRLGIINKSPSETAVYSKELKKELMTIHRDVIDRFYAEKSLNVFRKISDFRGVVGIRRSQVGKHYPSR